MALQPSDSYVLKGLFKYSIKVYQSFLKLILGNVWLLEQDYRLQFHIPPENSSNISLGRYMYRSVMPLPLIHLERSERSLAFNNVMAELEGLVALEEERLMVMQNNFII